MEYLITFYTHSGAIKYRRHLRELNLELKLKPVPRKVSSNCGVAGTIITQIDLLEHIISTIDCIYSVESNSYTLVYEND